MKKRSWDNLFEDDPAAGLLNLFDLWIVFSVALLLALFTCMHQVSQEELATSTAATPQERLQKTFTKAPRFRPTQASMTGDGMRLGVAYRLQSGEVVYVPDANAQ